MGIAVIHASELEKYFEAEYGEKETSTKAGTSLSNTKSLNDSITFPQPNLAALKKQQKHSTICQKSYMGMRENKIY